MPNTLNVAFDLTLIVQFFIPVVYICGFPHLYGHMIIQRSKYNKSIATEMAKSALKVDDE